MVLQIIFGMTAAVPVSLLLRFLRRILIEVLTKDPDAAIRVPNLETIRGYIDVISQRHPTLDGGWCTMDGLKLYLKTSADWASENNFYNDWKHNHHVRAVIVFCPDGTIPIFGFNVPGSVHDSLMAKWGSVYDKLGRVYARCGGKCTVDSAFSRKNHHPYLIKSSQTEFGEENCQEFGEENCQEFGEENCQEFSANVQLNAEATSMRQSAEWGMQALQMSFPRLKDRFIYEEYGKRRVMFKMILLLFNLRVRRRVGINQIRSTNMPALHVNANVFFAARW
jgi:hypothetical protein